MNSCYSTMDASLSPSDRLRLEYDGNQLVHVSDSVTSGHTYAGAFHFADGADEAVEYEYDENGNMTKDLNFSIEREQSMFACYVEREKNRLKVNRNICLLSIIC